jgi:PAS domain S-box-containing protein
MPRSAKKGKPTLTRNKPVAKKAAPRKATRAPATTKNNAKLDDVIASEERLNLALDASSMGIWEWNIKTNDVDWSHNVDKILGLKKKDFDFTFQAYMDLIHPEDQAGVLKEVQRALTNKSNFHSEHRLVWGDGSIHWIESLGKMTINKKGQPVKITGTVQDISSKKLLEFEREDWKKRHELIASSAGLVIYDYHIPTGNIIWSGNSEDVLGYKPHELGNIDRWVELIHPADREEAFKLLEIAQQALKPYDVYYRFSTQNGNYCYMHDRGFFIADKNNKAVRMLGMMQDVTERKQAIDQLNKSEQSYRELFDTVGEAIYFQRLDGVFIDVNKRATLMYGYDKEEFIGRTPGFLSAEGKNDLDAILKKIKRAAEGEPQAFEFWGRKKDGTEFLKEVRLTKGSYFGQEIIIATARDITERRAAEEALRDSELRFRTLQQASFGGIGLHDQGTILDCNQGLCDLTGYSYNELIGKYGIDLIAPEWRKIVIEKIQSNYEKPYDVEGIRKDGTRYFLEIHGKTIPYQNRNIRVTEFRDITERKRAEEETIEQNARLLSLTEDLRRKNNQLEEFTQIVSHNLRSPVGNIVTLINFCETASSENEREEYFALLKEASTITLSMLNELNDVLKIKQNKNIEKDELNFEQVLLQVKMMLNAKITSLSADIRYDFAPSPTISYPRIYLESILLNLLSNSLKYHHPDRKPVITFRTYLVDGNLILETSDNGLGINLQRYGHHIFKLRKTFHRHPESRGIGLFMIKNQIEAMGGEITLSSKENEGSTFFINFNKHHTDGN